MKRLFYAVVFAALMFAACTNSGRGVTTRISGRFVGSNVDTIYLERVADMSSAPERIAEGVIADNGAFSFEFDIEEGLSPRFYKLSFSGNTRPVTLVVEAGDDIVLESAGDIFLNYRVEGSEESALICLRSLGAYRREYLGRWSCYERLGTSGLPYRSGGDTSAATFCGC